MSRRRSLFREVLNVLKKAEEGGNKRRMQEIMTSNNYPPFRMGVFQPTNLSKFLDEEGNLIEGGFGSGLAGLVKEGETPEYGETQRYPPRRVVKRFSPEVGWNEMIKEYTPKNKGRFGQPFRLPVTRRRYGSGPLPYAQLLKHFRDAMDDLTMGGNFGRGAEGRNVGRSEIREFRGQYDDPRYDPPGDVEEHLDRKFENWQKKNKPGDKGYAKKFANWVKANSKSIKKIGKIVGKFAGPPIVLTEDMISKMPLGGISPEFNRGGMVKKYYSHGSTAKKKKAKKKKPRGWGIARYKGK